MLDIMRKHASSWGIKVLLGMIIVSFVLFFGYSQISEVGRPSVRGGGNEPAVAYVNHMAVPRSLYRFNMDNAMERMRAQYQGQPVPDFLEQMIERTVLSQLVQRELILQVADNLGVDVPDDRLAATVRAVQTDQRGTFDPEFYKKQFLPYFENRFGINFEDMLKGDLRVEMVRELFSPMEPQESDASATMNPATKAMRFSFQIVLIDTGALTDDGQLREDGEPRDVAQLFIDNPTAGQWKTMAAKYNATIENAEGVTLKERASKLSGYAFEDYRAIFALTDDVPVIDRPIVRPDNKLAVVRLIERAATTDEHADSADMSADFFTQWMSQLAARSRIRTFLDDDQTRK